MYQEPPRYSQVPMGTPVDDFKQEPSQPRPRPSYVDRRTEDERVLDEINAENNSNKHKKCFCFCALFTILILFTMLIVTSVDSNGKSDDNPDNPPEPIQYWCELLNVGKPPSGKMLVTKD